MLLVDWVDGFGRCDRMRMADAVAYQRLCVCGGVGGCVGDLRAVASCAIHVTLRVRTNDDDANDG